MAKVRKVSKESLLRSVCRESFKMFVKEFWECIPGSSDLVWNWHMDVLCEELQTVAERVFAGEKKQYDLVINISPGSSKPVWEEMPVLMADGTYKPLREVRVGDRVIGKTGKGCVVTAVHEQGLQSCVKILTASKREIIAATDHPIMTTMGWTKAGMVTIGDHLGLMHSPQIEGSTTRSIDEFSLAGYFIGDGSVTHGNCALTSKDPEYIEDFCAVSQRLGFIPNVRVARNGVTVISLKSKKRESQRGRFKGKGRGFNGRKTEGPRGWLREIGMMGKSSRTKEIPDFVWKGSNEQVAAFLAAYFHCDGCVSYKHEGKKNISVSFCSVSRNLALGIQRLLLRLGICMRLDKHVAKNGFVYNRGLKNYSYYIVNTTDQDSASRFLELIPLLGRKKDKLKDFEPERRTFQQRFWPDRVVSAEQAGMLPCRCLTVEGDRSFVVEGVVVHNSSLCSILFQPWTWTRMPCARHITASHTDTLALDLANKSRAVVNSDKYQACFPEIQIRSDQDSKGYFINTSGGDRITATVGGKSPIGFHGHFLTVDDPLDPKKALSEVELKLASSFMTDTLPSRKVDKAVSVTITIMQRLHDDDPSGHLIKRHEKGLGTIRHLCLPARLTDYVHPPELKDRYIDGLMDPKRLGEEILRDMENALGAYSFAGQFLQSPIPLSGGMFKEEYFNQRVKAAPYHAKRIRYWDRACFCQGTIIKTEGGDKPIEMVFAGDRVLTRAGYRRVLWSGVTKMVSSLTGVRFSNGSVLLGTDDHRVWTKNRKWVNMGELCSSDVCLSSTGEQVWPERVHREKKPHLLLSLMGFPIDGSREESITKRCDGTRKRKGTTTIPYIVPSGESIEEALQAATISITKMGTQKTTISKIWNVFPERSITNGMLLSFAGWRESRNCSFRTSGTHGQNDLMPNTNVCFVKERSEAEQQATNQNIAQIPADTDSNLIPVYDLTVEGESEFYANGILVHNSSINDVAGCYTAGVLIAKDDRGDYYIEHCVHGQWEPTERNEKMRATALRDRARYGPSDEPVIWVEAEGGSSGRDAWKGVARALAGFHVREDRVTGKKEFRAEPWSAQLAAKNVYIVDNGESQGTGRSDWDIESYVKEHCLFPMAKLKDQVDASTGAFNLLAGVRSSGTLKIMQYRVADRKSKHDDRVRVWVCSKKDLELLFLQDKYLLISLENKTEVAPVTSAVVVKKQNELDTETIQFMDVSPEERQDRWDEPVEPYGKLPHEIIATKEDGKKFWRFLLKKRLENPKAVVIQDDGDDDRRAVSVAAALCDSFRLSREKTIYRLADDSKVIAEKDEPPNRHVYNIIRTTRNLIV